MDIFFREIKEEDRKPVVDIINYYIDNGYTTVPDRDIPYECFDSILKITDGYTRIAAIDRSNGDTVAGFAYMRPVTTLSPKREAYLRTAYVTYYLLPEYIHKGIGSKIVSFLIDEAKKRDIDCLLADISGFNEESIRFHEKMGFVHCGVMKRVGRKFGKDLDVVIMQKFI